MTNQYRSLLDCMEKSSQEGRRSLTLDEAIKQDPMLRTMLEAPREFIEGSDADFDPLILEPSREVTVYRGVEWVEHDEGAWGGKASKREVGAADYVLKRGATLFMIKRYQGAANPGKPRKRALRKLRQGMHAARNWLSELFPKASAYDDLATRIAIYDMGRVAKQGRGEGKTTVNQDLKKLRVYR